MSYFARGTDEHGRDITCTGCGHAQREVMPMNACQWFYDCGGCGVLQRPKLGDCWAIYSFADQPCPPIQEAGASCCR